MKAPYGIRQRLEWATVGLIIGALLIWLAYYMVTTQGDAAGFAALITGLLGLGVIRQFIFYPPETSAGVWWYRNCRKLDIVLVQGKYYYGSHGDIRTWVLYDREGNHVGWCRVDYDRYHHLQESPEPHRRGVTRFSLWRSPTLPRRLQAEVLDESDEVIGYATVHEV